MPLKPGVGYAVPKNEITYDGWPIDQTVIIPAPGEASDAAIRAAMLAKFGPKWEEGRGYMHDSDHAAFLREAWARAQRGIDVQGLLIDNGNGYDGIPTATEFTTSHRGARSRTAEIVARVVPGSPGYGVMPFDTEGDHDRQQWSTATWREAITGRQGSYRHESKEWKATALRQLDIIEAGERAGWWLTPAGEWRPDPTAIPHVVFEASQDFDSRVGEIKDTAVGLISEAEKLLERAVRLIDATR